MNNKGFFLLEGLIVFSLGITLMFSCLQTYNSCLKTMNKKLLLEEAVTAADLALTNQSNTTRLQINETEKLTNISELTLKEVQISYEDKVIFTITVAK